MPTLSPLVLDSAALTLTGHDTGISIYYAAFLTDTSALVVSGNQASIGIMKNMEDSFGLGDDSNLLIGVTLNDIITLLSEEITTANYFESLEEAIVFLETLASGFGVSIVSELQTGDTLDTLFSLFESLVDNLGFEIAEENREAFFETLVSSFIVLLAVRERVGLFIADEVSLSDEAVGSLDFFENLADYFGFAHTSNSYANFFEAFISELALELEQRYGFSATIQDSFGVASDLISLASFYAAVTSTLSFGVSESNKLVVYGNLADSVGFSEDLTTSALFNMLLEDSLAFVATLTLDGIDYVAWVLNTALGSFTKYTNYGFNSYMQIGDKLFALAEDGVYLVGGTDDDGKDINASFRSGLMDFGDAHRKNVRVVYLGAASSGDMLLKATTTRDGERKTDVYRLSPKSSGRIDRMTKELSNARQARYWEFEIENVDGESLEIDEISWRLMLLKTKDY